MATPPQTAHVTYKLDRVEQHGGGSRGLLVLWYALPGSPATFSVTLRTRRLLEMTDSELQGLVDKKAAMCAGR